MRELEVNVNIMNINELEYVYADRDIRFSSTHVTFLFMTASCIP
jgi:hypothetical protein